MENECRHLTAPFPTCGEGSKGHESLLESWQAWIEDRAVRASIMGEGGREEGKKGIVGGQPVSYALVAVERVQKASLLPSKSQTL
jgi:hypothetical protein